MRESDHESEAAERVAALREEIRHHDRLYYIESQPEVSDAEYDALFRELQELEESQPELLTADSPTQRVGAPLEEGEGFEKARHDVPMLSIDSLYEEQEVREFEEKLRRFLKTGEDEVFDWAVEPKFDGVSAALLYEDGILRRGLTRGDGTVGEDITRNLKTVRNIPLVLTSEKRPLPRLLEVRGEVLMQRAAFERFNARRESDGQPVLANPRNATSGALRRNDPHEVAKYPLEFHTWAVVRIESEEQFSMHTEVFAAVRDWGLPDSGHGKRVAGLAACLAYHDDIEARRFEMPFEMDGVVAKLDRLDLRERLGRTSRSNRWQYAHKFAPIEATSTLRAIEIMVGTNGRLTPRAHVDPVEVGGVTVRHTTLHNADHVEKLGLRVGDRVFLERAGDVIPQVMGVAKPAQGKETKAWRAAVPEELLGEDGEVRPGIMWGWREPFHMPRDCPACGTEAVQVGKYWLCPNGLDCKPQLVGRTELLCGRTAFEIDRLGKKLIRQLVEADMIRTPADVFHLKPDPLLELERWGEKSVQNLMTQLEERRAVPFDRFLVSLAIPEVGSATARLLARHFSTLEDLQTADEEQLVQLEGIGPEMARAILQFFAAEQTGRLIERLLAGGVKIVFPDPSQQTSGELADKTIVFTGTLAGLSRAEAKRLAEGAGAKVTSAVSAKTDFVVTGAVAGSKRKKAEELGVAILDEEGFLGLVGR
jgi:DNA ligase (NAD+)